MTLPVIQVENLSKKFIISHESQERYTSLRDIVAKRAKGLITRSKNSTQTVKEEFFALKDIDLSISPGDRVGIIGRNGAGKSTLLKVLSRITEPTSGKITIRGRVASLLEVGTGFHPELTGRENIFLNGAILGMSRAEIRSKFDEIVAFAEIEKFLDTPVKRYSSGMYVRLAFAVAAHLEPEILIVDEVLAVGDAQFQKKCLGKMEDVSKNDGRTVLFVSHNMQAISHLCNKGVYLANGQVILHDKIDKVIDTYLKHGETLGSQEELMRKIQSAPSDPTFRLNEIHLIQDQQEVISNVVNGKPLEIIVNYELFEKTTALRIFADFCDDLGTVIFRSFHDENADGIPAMEPGIYTSRMVLPANLLAPITYDLRIMFGIHNIRMLPPGDGINIRINVEQTGTYNRSYGGMYTAGKVCPSIPWMIQKS
jgi:lipopolysaccharide transport system ATP-binding protein